MTPPLDSGLLAHARAAGAKLIDAEKQLAIARAEYHAEVRRLHLAGASFREIAAALGMSHQRVQQIVEQAGGSWWSKVWRNRRVSVFDNPACSFCGRARAQVEKLISGPDVLICDTCVMRAERAAKDGGEHSPFARATKTDAARCSFCGERQHARGARGDKQPIGPMIAAARNLRVCSRCLGECRKILDESA